MLIWSRPLTNMHVCFHVVALGPTLPPRGGGGAGAGTIICFVTYLRTYSMDTSPSWEANRFSVQIFPTFYGTRRFIKTFRSARHSVLFLVFRNHLPKLSHITKLVADSCFGRKIMNSLIRIGLQVWNGSCELLRALKTCLRAVGSACLFF